MAVISTDTTQLSLHDCPPPLLVAVQNGQAFISTEAFNLKYNITSTC